MDIELKGDLTGLSKQQLNLIKNVLKELKFDGKDITIDVLGQAGENFTSGLKVIKINNDGKIIKVIVKITQNMSRSLNNLNDVTHILFHNEIVMYSEVLPMMVQLQKNAGISEKDILQYATLYGASKESAHEIILLEDLTKAKYVIMDRFKPLTNDTIKLVLQTLALYHSLSYFLRENAPDMFAEFCKNLIHISTSNVIQQYAESYKALGDNFGQLFDDKIYANITVNTIKRRMDNLVKLIQSDEGSKYSVIVHGDCWTNNFLFQMQDDQPTKCIMIDYQLVRESLPVVDVLQLIFNCTDYQTRSKHYYDWLDHYHSHLDKYLFAYGLKINCVYPRDIFDADLKRYSKSCLGTAILSVGLFIRKNKEAAVIREAFTESDNMGDMLNSFKVSQLECDTMLKIKNRIEELITSLIDFGYLNTVNYI